MPPWLFIFFIAYGIYFAAGFVSKWPAFFDLFSSLFGTCNLFEKVMVPKESDDTNCYNRGPPQVNQHSCFV